MSQHHLDQQLNSEAQRSNSLVAQLQAMVAEREAKVRHLEMEIGQLNVHVSRALAQRPNPFSSRASPSSSFHFFPLALAQARLHPSWLHFGHLLLSGSPTHSAHKPDCPCST